MNTARTSMLPRLVAAVLTAACLAGAAHAQSGPAARPLVTIEKLDVPRYLGKWYEIAKFPNRFQKKCVGETSATYCTLPDGRLRVLNRCRTAEGTFDEAEGVARQPGGATSPRLEVRFAPAILSFLPFVWGDYWVVDLDEAYTLAAVSEPQREYLWILSRSPQVDRAHYDALLARLTAQGLDVGKLVPTPQR